MLSTQLLLTDESMVGVARREAVLQAHRLGFDETTEGKVAIVVTELANNIVRHARAGKLLLRTLDVSGVAGIEILAVDSGPGMGSVVECFRDGFSTGGTPGTGLGAVTRLSSEFDVYSQPGSGTAIMSRLWTKMPPRSQSLFGSFEIGVVCLPIPGEIACGDGWVVHATPISNLIMVVDGLGHGALAAVAADTAIRIFNENVSHSPEQILKAAHQALRSTRGAALAVLRVELDREKLRFSGIGNVNAAIVDARGKSQTLVSHNGTVGYVARAIQEFEYRYSLQSLLVVHSDGLSARWSLDGYPGLLSKHPALIAAVLHRDFSRGTDDVTILVAKQGRGL